MKGYEMTWQELFEKIPKDQLDSDVSIYDDYEDEYYPMKDCSFCEDGILDDGCFYIVF